MSTKLYQNSEGKVLMSVGNKLIKQPHEFGLAFQNRMGLNNYINITGLNISTMSVLSWGRSPVSGLSSPILGFFFETNNYNMGGSANSIGSIDTRKNGWPGVTSTSVGIVSSTFNYGTYGFTKTPANNIRPLCDIYGNESNSIIFTDTTLNRITLLAAKSTAGAGTVNGFSNQNVSVNRLIVYNRIINSGEFYYFLDNKLGNNPQSILDIELDIKCDKAEILDFSSLQDGSDMRVGCRDYSGFNRHGEIMNLPAGTLQQKVDYANANLFVPFK